MQFHCIKFLHILTISSLVSNICNFHLNFVTWQYNTLDCSRRLCWLDTLSRHTTHAHVHHLGIFMGRIAVLVLFLFASESQGHPSRSDHSVSHMAPLNHLQLTFFPSLSRGIPLEMKRT